MATILELKIRERTDVLRIATTQVLQWVKSGEEEGKQHLWDYFSPIQDENKATVHDKVFLENIINWQPVDEKSGRPIGLALTKQARWIKLAQRVNHVDESKPGKIVLANKDIDAIMERIQSPAYKMGPLSEPFIDFLFHLQKTTGRWLEELEPSEDDDKEAMELEALLVKETEGSNEHGERIEVSAGS